MARLFIALPPMQVSAISSDAACSMLDADVQPGRMLDGPHAGAWGSDAFVLQYRMRWPLNEIISQASINSYADVFSQLLRLRCIAHGLSTAWAQLTKPSSGLGAATLRVSTQWWYPAAAELYATCLG